MEWVCCVKDSVEGVELWLLLGGVKGWVLGMVMVCFLVLGDGELLVVMWVLKLLCIGYDLVLEEEREVSSVFVRWVVEVLDFLDKVWKV